MLEEQGAAARGGKKKTASTKNAVLRVSSDRTSVLVPQQHRRVQGLTLYLAGAVANGAVLADVLRQCSGGAAAGDGGLLLRRITIERRDNDWDAPATEFRLTHEDSLAEALRSCHALEEISIMGLTSSVQNVCEALCELPKLGSVTLKADPHYSSSDRKYTPPPLLSPSNLRHLLQTVQHRLSLAGVFPESPAYTSVLHEAFVQQGCRLHIFVHFSGTQKQPSPYAYFLRDIMQLNQMGRLQAPPPPPAAANNNMWKMLQHVRRRSTSLDAAYVLIRDNPWLCHPRTPSSNEKTKKKRGWKGKIRGLVARARGRA